MSHDDTDSDGAACEFDDEGMSAAERIFLAASDLPPSQRAPWVASQCAGDELLLNEVQQMLGAMDEATDYFGGLADRLGLAKVLDPEFAPEMPERIGQYRLIRLLGRGGMGAVYLADRADQQFDKQVAVKLLPYGVGGREARTRFLAERQILAKLEHPNIARLLDGGITEQGTPYFVMEYVEGVPIDRYCNQHRLTVRERLRLFQQVCEAVQYAHGNLIVHRDIKPGNVLVDPQGNVRLLDFGIAKVVDGDGAGETLTRGARAMTPAYASPEMVRGELVTTASDVYALGVLLYELLAGVQPHQLDTLSEVQIAQTIAQEEPAPLSRAVSAAPRSGDDPQAVAATAADRSTSPARLRAQLEGDLDNIVAMALRKSVEHRYRSVEKLSEDIERHLTRLPVAARPATLRYRAGRFFARNRLVVISASLAAIMLAAVAVIATNFALVTQRQANEIALERDRAEQVKDFLLGVFSRASPHVNQGEEVTARDLLDQAAERINEELSDQPDLQAQMLGTMAQSYTNLSIYDRAGEVLDVLVGLQGASAGVRSKVHVDALMAKAEVVERQGDYEAGLALGRKAVELASEFDAPATLARAQLIRGRMLHRLGQLEAGEEDYRAAVTLLEASGERGTNLSEGLAHLGSVLSEVDKLDEADAVLTRAFEIEREVYGPNHMNLVDTVHNLANVKLKRDLYEESLGMYQQLLDMYQVLAPDGHSDEAYFHNGKASVYREMNRLEDAETSARAALAALEPFFDDAHPNVIILQANLGEVLLRKGDPQAARPLLETAVTALQEKMPAHPRVQRTQVSLGQVYAALGDAQRARQLLQTAYQVLLERMGEDNEMTQKAAQALAELDAAATPAPATAPTP